MSEYPGIRNTPRSIADLDNRGTLFDTDPSDDELDRVVDTQNISYSDARQRLGYEASPSQMVSAGHDQDNEHGVYITLDERAFALQAIMEYLNKANQTNGSRVHIDHGGQQMRQRYGEFAIHDVQEGAEVNRDKLFHGFVEGIKSLAAVEQMRAHGYRESTIEHERMVMQIDINREFGVKKAYATKRNKAVTDAKRVADYVSGRKKPRRRPASQL